MSCASPQCVRVGRYTCVLAMHSSCNIYMSPFATLSRALQQNLASGIFTLVYVCLCKKRVCMREWEKAWKDRVENTKKKEKKIYCKTLRASTLTLTERAVLHFFLSSSSSSSQLKRITQMKLPRRKFGRVISNGLLTMATRRLLLCTHTVRAGREKVHGKKKITEAF